MDEDDAILLASNFIVFIEKFKTGEIEIIWKMRKDEVNRLRSFCCPLGVGCTYLAVLP
jgi:hypothetical protein